METKLIKRAQGPGGDQRVLVTITEKWGEGGGATVTPEQLPGLGWSSQYWVR